MKIQQEISKFKWLMLLLPPALGVALNLIMFGKKYIQNWHILVFSSLIIISTMVLLSPIQISIANFMRNRQTSDNRLVLRMLLATLLHLPVTSIIISCVILLYSSVPIFGYQFSRTDCAWGIFAGVVCDIIGIAMNEGIYSYHQWKETKLEAEQLSKEKLQTQLNSLLQQINPHFLFNSLNSLSALISENTTDAQQYLLDLSKVYRYLLRTNQDELTTLATEISFVDSYFHLLQTRFGSGVQLITAIRPVDYGSLLPPLTLQLLIENAVKHNTVGKNKPLVIRVHSTGDYLIVKNNLQRKSIRVESNKVGLSNIAEKYRLINKTTIEIVEENDTFCVKVPLIESSATPRHLTLKDS